MVWQWLADFRRPPRRPLAGTIPHPPRRTVPPPPVFAQRTADPAPAADVEPAATLSDLPIVVVADPMPAENRDMTASVALPTMSDMATPVIPAATATAPAAPMSELPDHADSLAVSIEMPAPAPETAASLNAPSAAPATQAPPLSASQEAFAQDLQDLATTIATPCAEPVAENLPEAPARRRVSVTRDLGEPPLATVSPSNGLEVPEAFVPEDQPVRERSADSWQDHLLLAMTDAGSALAEWPGTSTMSGLRQALATTASWRELMTRLTERGVTDEDLIPTLAVAEARGWVTITSDVADGTLDLAAFLRDTGLLSIDQVASLISESQAFRECRFDALCRELVGKKMLSLAKAGFLNRLGRLAPWHVVPAPSFTVAEAG